VRNEETYEAADVSGYKNNEWLHFTKGRLGCQIRTLVLQTILSPFHFSYLVLLAYYYILKKSKYKPSLPAKLW